MVQRLLSYPTQYMNPVIRSTLHHIKLKSQNFLQRIDFDIIQDEEKLVLNSDQGRLWFPSAILALSLVSINIILLHIAPCGRTLGTSTFASRAGSLCG